MQISYQLLGLTTPLLALSAFAMPLAKLLKSTRLPFVLALIATTFSVISTTLVFVELVSNGAKPLVYMYGGWPPHFGIVYEVDAFNALLGVLTAWVMLAITIYSYWYRAHLDDPVWYYVLLLGLEAGILGCLFTGDAFNLFVMIEVLSISAYGLVAYHRDKAEAVEAAAKYALIGAVATVFYFTAVVLLYAGYGSVNMGVLSLASRLHLVIPLVRAPESLRYIALLSVALSLWVFTYKSAVFPNHFWLPDAHPEAPTPISAALSGLVVNVGVYAAARFLYTIFGEDSVLAEYRIMVFIALFALGAISGFVGALMMMYQRDIKRLLAYSTISHMGIAFMGVSAGFLNSSEAVKLAVLGGIVHIVAHSIAKAMLFMASGVFIDAGGSRDLDEIRGVGRHYPLTSLATTIGFLSLAGFIPFIGFYSKLYIIQGYLNAGFALAAVLIIAISALSLLGYLKVISAVVFSVGKGEVKILPERWVEVVLLLMALSLLALGVLFTRIMWVYERAATSLVFEYGDYIRAALDSVPGELRPLIYEALWRALGGVKP